MKRIDLPAMSKRTFSAHETIHFAWQDGEEKRQKKKKIEQQAAPVRGPPGVAPSLNPETLRRLSEVTSQHGCRFWHHASCPRALEVSGNPPCRFPVQSARVAFETSLQQLHCHSPWCLCRTVVLSVCLCFFAVMLIDTPVSHRGTESTVRFACEANLKDSLTNLKAA